MRCLHCGKQLALFKKLTGGGEFCSDAHKQSYHEEYNKLALSRLMEAQTRQEDHSARQPGGGAGAPTPPETPALAEPTARGGYLKQPVAARSPGIAVASSLAQKPAGWPIGFPPGAELHFAPEPGRAGVIMEHRGVPGAAVIAPAPDFLRIRLDPRCSLPESHFEVDAVVPAAAGPVKLDVIPAPPPQPELTHESALSFQLSGGIPEGLDLAWVDGLELASCEQKLAAPQPATPQPATLQPATLQPGAPPESESVEEIARSGAATADAGVPLRAQALSAAQRTATASVPEPAVEPNPVVSVLASATPEPVIDDALLLSLLGGDDEAAPPPSPSPAAVVMETPVVAAQEIATPQTGPSVPAAETAPGPVPPRQPGSFLPVTIRPAGAPNKPRLMQSFQAIALVSANPQIPTWNMLPLRPKMALGRPPGPGATLLDRARPEAGAPSEARTPGSAAIEVANGPEPPLDLPVPTFGSATKPRAGLSRWFKLSVLAGVLGIAGSSGWPLHPAEARAAGARQHTTTEFAACRN